MADYSRDTDIGKVRADTSVVSVSNFASVISAIEAATRELQEATVELRKIALGTGLITGTDPADLEAE